ncbi:conjugal transfer protein TrbD [Burkholderia aenigmatica]|uniref:conjugal transfer protein TrbD n=1 Tax=Burkholderia aenigmatica TaxID=2015348 RepID=UPI00264C2DA3|nr:conjugal transfer protein TrbD [Burkholderia aenigmatica]MDN7880111.1 conjugal transfer protein TrbD [Burkholderia aenigmatica]
MALDTVHIRRSGNRHNLFMGGDRELVMFSGLLAFALAFASQTWYAIVFGTALWIAALYVLRLMAKADPKLRHKYIRNRRYKKRYPPHSTPYRTNGTAQGRRYK